MKRRSVACLFILFLSVIFLVACVMRKGTESKYKIGILQFVSHPAIDSIVKGIQDGLKSINIDDKNALIDLKIANADNSLALNIARKFVYDKCDLIVAITTGGAQAAYNATRGTDIPVVFVGVSEPVDAGIIKSKQSPETNITGISDVLDIQAQLELIKSLLPNAKTIGVVYNPGEINSYNEVELLKTKAKDFGYQIKTSVISSTADLPLALDDILNNKIDVLLNTLDNTLMSGLSLEIEKADKKNIPIIASANEQVQNGALASNSFDQYDIGLESVDIIKKVLDGESPNNIPVRNCETKKLFINKSQAEKYNIKIPEGAIIT